MIWHDVEQNGEEWDALRLGKATASNFGLIMANDGKAFGEPAKRYAIQLALEQIKGCKSEFGFSNEHMERGHEQEPIARMLYEEMNFVDVDNGGFFDHETYGDSPDGLVGQDGLVEIKSVIAATPTPPSPAAPSIRHTDGNWSVTLIALAGIGWTSSATAQTSRTVSSSSSIALQLPNVNQK